MARIFRFLAPLAIVGIISNNYVVAELSDIESDGSLLLNNEECGKRHYEKSEFPVNSRLFEHPWLVRFGFKRDDLVIYIFQGLLIHKEYVLTTVHVARFEDFGQLTYARLGEYNTTSDRDCIEGNSNQNKDCAPAVQDILVDVVIPHPDFNLFKQSNNIALVKLRSAANINGLSVVPICLNQELDVEAFLYTASWCGRRDTGLSMVPKQYQLEKISPQDCSDRMPGYTIHLTDGMFCVIFGKTHRTPQADKKKEPNLRGGNGGPIFTVQGDNKIYLIGLLSYGPRYPAALDQPYIITPVAPYYNWFTETIQSDLEKRKYTSFT